MKKQLLFIAFLVISLMHTVSANIRLPGILSDHMVLQQKEKVALWGWNTPNTEISISTTWNSKETRTTSDASGKWMVAIKTPVAGGPYTIHFKSEQSNISLHNVLIGEVWLCSGQSNMDFPVAKQNRWKTGVVNYEEELKDADYPQIRLFHVAQKVADTPTETVAGNWQACSASSVSSFSAVAYFYGKELHKTLGVPIGLIQSSWGGTPAESWTKKEVLESESDFLPILERYQNETKNFPEVYEAWRTRYKKWQAGVKDGSITGDAAVSGPRKPVDSNSNKSPYKLFNGMIYPLIPYTIQGVIWYQGESNAQRALQYQKLFPAMIECWRDEWNQGDFPFYFVQITPHRSQNPEIREAQFKTLQNVKNTGMVVTTDAGDLKDIHPRNKQIVGKRLSLWALNKTYKKKKTTYSGPLYKSMKIKKNTIQLSFDYVSDGLYCDGDSLTCFTIAGKDQKFLPAQAKIEGNKIVVWSDEISNPVAVRFGWDYYFSPNLYNSEKLPASPFRTDDWPGKYLSN